MEGDKRTDIVHCQVVVRVERVSGRRDADQAPAAADIVLSLALSCFHLWCIFRECTYSQKSR